MPKPLTTAARGHLSVFSSALGVVCRRAIVVAGKDGSPDNAVVCAAVLLGVVGEGLESVGFKRRLAISRRRSMKLSHFEEG